MEELSDYMFENADREWPMKYKKPTLGIMPQWLWVEERMSLVIETIERYKSDNVEVPIHLFREQSEHFVWLDTYRREKKMNKGS
jgi:hypothetical protein